MKTMNIALPDGLKEYVQARVSGGGYSSASEFIRKLIREDQQSQSNSQDEVMAVVHSRPGRRRDAGFRSVEMEFRYKNAAHLAQLYPGQWLAIEGEEVIAAGLDLVDVAAAARQRGIRSPYVVQIDTRPPEMPRMGF